MYAHPDDETLSGGGTFAKYAAAGVRCTLYCATDGDAGQTSGLPIGSPRELARVRREELRVAASILGFAEVDSARHPDGKLGTLDPRLLLLDIVQHIRREQPQVVVTFGPEGAPNTHPDHRTISMVTTAAFFLAANPSAFMGQTQADDPHTPARLYYVTWPPPPATAVLRTFGVPATARIDVRQQRATELKAWRAHASQQALQQRFDETAATDDELFALAAGVPQPAPLVDDLFAGLSL